MSRGASIFLLAVLLIALSVSAYLLYENLPIGARQELSIKNLSSSADNGESYAGNEKMQFYLNMRFAKLPISYSINSECSAEKTGQMQSAIEIISARAEISFVQVSAGGDIEIMCREINNKEIRNKEFYVAGEGGQS